MKKLMNLQGMVLTKDEAIEYYGSRFNSTILVDVVWSESQFDWVEL
jgi:hypothetical protein